jgi:phosphatidylserine decarboxylase
VEQVKGMTYSISGFLGSSIGEFQKIKNSKLYHAVLYLAPGDYHRIHSPADWIINQRRHFPGTLFPVAPHTFGKVIPNLLALNERIVLTGEWTQGFFSLSGNFSIELTVNESH